MSSTPLSSTYVLGIPPDKLANSKAAILTLRTDLLPYLRDLNAGERRALLKKDSSDFCDKTYAHTDANPQMKPGVVDFDAYTQTAVDSDTIGDIVRDLAPVINQAQDSLLLLNSQKYSFSLACYNGFKLAAKMKMPGAELIVADLAPRFANQGRVAKASKARAPQADKAEVPVDA